MGFSTAAQIVESSDSLRQSAMEVTIPRHTQNHSVGYIFNYNQLQYIYVYIYIYTSQNIAMQLLVLD